MKDAKPIPSTGELVESKSRTMQPKAATTPYDLLSIAVNQGADLDRLEKLMDLQIRWEENEAKKEYMRNMAEARKNPPELHKNQKASFQAKGGTTEYDYITLDKLTNAVSRWLGPFGFTFSWDLDTTDKIRVTCTVTHALGHSESTTLSAGADQTGSKNAIQAMGSSITYLQKYTLLARTGLAAKGMDTDGIVDVETISPQQIADLVALADEVGADPVKFCKFYKIEDIEQLPKDKFKQAVAMLEKKRNA